MKSTSKKSTGLLGGFDFQPVFSEQTLSQSEPKEEEASQTKPNKNTNRAFPEENISIRVYWNLSVTPISILNLSKPRN